MQSGGIARTLLVAGGVLAALHLPLGKVWTASSRVLFTSEPGGSRVQFAAGGCGSGAWSRPAALGGLPAGALPRTPRLSVGERQTFVVGQNWTVADRGPL